MSYIFSSVHLVRVCGNKHAKLRSQLMIDLEH